MKEKELVLRSVPLGSVETREAEGKKHITGIIPFDSLSEDLGGFREVIRKSAFTKTLKEGDARCLWAHNTQYVLGRRSADTLTLEEREDGLHFDCELPSSSWAQDVFETVSRRDAPGVSFGFYVIKDRWTRSANEKEPDLRELLEVRLLEVSVGVAFPAYPESGSDASTRALLEDAGISIEKLAAVLSRAKGKNDYICEGEEIQTVRSAAEALLKLLPKEPENVQEKPDSDSTDTAMRSNEPGAPTQPESVESTYRERTRELELMEAEYWT